MTPEQVRQIVKEELEALIGSDRFTFQKNIQIFDARDIQVGRTNGTKIGTATDQKLALYGKTPIVQQGTISNPAGGATQDAEARTVIQSIITAMRNFGIIA